MTADRNSPAGAWMLRTARLRLGLTQVGLAARLGLDPGTLSRMERRNFDEPWLRLALDGLAVAIWRESMAAVARLTLERARELEPMRKRRRARDARRAARVHLVGLIAGRAAQLGGPTGAATDES